MSFTNGIGRSIKIIIPNVTKSVISLLFRLLNFESKNLAKVQVPEAITIYKSIFFHKERIMGIIVSLRMSPKVLAELRYKTSFMYMGFAEYLIFTWLAITRIKNTMEAVKVPLKVLPRIDIKSK